ncbi:hypothetical protein F4680DRAFT_447483 [Xylaria scruposa]|nr:hypothetical protein F4680DRAFT_447483 [Xylaria scruposa]
MGLIYAAAYSTVVFLGYSTPGSQLLFRHLARTDRWISSDAEQKAKPLPKPPRKIVRELESLLKRPRFSRVWVIQEIMRSSRVTFMCGRGTATIDALTHCLYGNERNMRILNKFPAPLELDHELFREELEKCSTPARQIYFLAAEAGLCESSDPRDRILALTPLCRGITSEINDLVDYEQETESIFHKFSLLFLRDGGLALLWMIRHPHRNERMPGLKMKESRIVPKTYQHFLMPTIPTRRVIIEIFVSRALTIIAHHPNLSSLAAYDTAVSMNWALNY